MSQTFDYSKVAETAYTNLKSYFDASQSWGDYGNYWKLGNAFDTATDYVVYCGVPDSELAGLAYAKYQAVLEKNPNSACWYDDYGWWGIASAKAFDPRYAAVFSGQESNFQSIAWDCWGTMNTGKSNPEWKYKGAPNAWNNRDDGNPDQSYWNNPENWATPRFNDGPGSGLQGVWQYDIFHEKRSTNECSPSNPSDPNQCSLGPFQNTVVNGLYFVLAQRLLNAVAGDQSTLQPAKDLYGFLQAWFDMKLGNDSTLIRFASDAVLVRERVTTYAMLPSGNYPALKEWNNTRDTCWAGDQGLIMSGLVDYLNINPQDPMCLSVSQAIVGGVVTHMTDLKGVIQYNYDELGDFGDYKCGVGVFMRYLLYAYNQPSSPIKALVDENQYNIKSVLLATANDACQSTPSDLFDNFNVLSILTTAKALGIVQF
jgi:hypothetical protein